MAGKITAMGGSLDVNSIVSQLMNVERAPLAKLQKEQAGIKHQALGLGHGEVCAFRAADGRRKADQAGHLERHHGQQQQRGPGAGHGRQQQGGRHGQPFTGGEAAGTEPDGGNPQLCQRRCRGGWWHAAHPDGHRERGRHELHRRRRAQGAGDHGSRERDRQGHPRHHQPQQQRRERQPDQRRQWRAPDADRLAERCKECLRDLGHGQRAGCPECLSHRPGRHEWQPAHPGGARCEDAAQWSGRELGIEQGHRHDRGV